MSWLQLVADQAEERLRSMPYDHLGPAARRLRDHPDEMDSLALLDDVRRGVYG